MTALPRRLAPAILAACLHVGAASTASGQPQVAPAPAPLTPVAPVAPAPGQPKFSFGSQQEAAELDKAKQVEWKLSAQASVILNTGNSRVTNLAAGLNASRKANRNKFSVEAGAAYARSRILLAVDDDANGTIEEDDLSRPSVTTTRSWGVKGRYDRYLTTANALYGAAGIFSDEPAGKELVGSGQIGYSRLLHQDAVHLLVAEAGYDFTYEDQVSGDAVSIHSLRGFLGYTGKLREQAGLEISVEALSNLNRLDAPGGEIAAFDDNRLNGKLSLTMLLVQDLSFRVGFEARYDQAPAPRPPFDLPYAEGFVPLADELDTRAEATLIVSLL